MSKIKRKVKNVVLYLRFSCSKQSETSIEGQDKRCTEFCKANGYNIINKYIDRATSASKDIEKRVAFNQMIKDSRKGKFDAVVCYKIDRFSRNVYDTVLYLNRLENLGISVLTAEEGGNDDTPEGILLRQIMIGFSAYYSKELSQKVVRGMRIAAEKGQMPGGTRLFGYNLVNKKYVVNEVEGPIVKEVFARMCNNEKYQEICNDLNARGLSFKGKPFTIHTLERFYRRLESYRGTVIFQDIRTENAFEPLITEEQYIYLKEKESSRERYSHSQRSFPLSKKLFCEACPKMCHAKLIGKSAKKKYFYYDVNFKIKPECCVLKPIKKDEIEIQLVSLLLSVFTYKENIDMFTKAISTKMCQILQAKSYNIGEGLHELKKLEEQKKNALMLSIQNPKNADDYLQIVNSLNKQINDINDKISQEKDCKILQINETKIGHFLQDFINHRYSEKQKKELFELFCSKIIKEVVILKDNSFSILLQIDDEKARLHRGFLRNRKKPSLVEVDGFSTNEQD